MPTRDAVATAIRDGLISPNESDSNFEAANVVDAIYMLARAVRTISHGTHTDPAPLGLEGLAIAIGGEGLKSSLAQAVAQHGDAVGGGLDAIAVSLDGVAAELKRLADALHNRNDR